jgi:hypothetical protein
MIRWYVLPVEEVDVEGMPARGPKYFSWRFSPDGVLADWQMMDYGRINAAILVADVTQAQHDELVANPDCVSPPENIDQNITAGAIPAVQNVLEALRIPAGWVTTDYTYRDILRMVAGLFQFSQRHHGLFDEDLIPNQAALDLRWNQIQINRRNRIRATVSDLNYDPTGITNQTTVRQILWNFAQQWGNSEFYFGSLGTL